MRVRRSLLPATGASSSPRGGRNGVRTALERVTSECCEFRIASRSRRGPLASSAASPMGLRLGALLATGLSEDWKPWPAPAALALPVLLGDLGPDEGLEPAASLTRAAAASAPSCACAAAAPGGAAVPRRSSTLCCSTLRTELRAGASADQGSSALPAVERSREGPSASTVQAEISSCTLSIWAAEPSLGAVVGCAARSPTCCGMASRPGSVSSHALAGLAGASSSSLAVCTWSITDTRFLENIWLLRSCGIDCAA
mmetsp:Transcript_3934/g.10848  ORF Transcript_3934/g.10848 Transcript_3934/m.10848 type:complete len:256 (-) Transcript_3934:826-1593(-)